jgi:hypothetical protein
MPLLCAAFRRRLGPRVPSLRLLRPQLPPSLWQALETYLGIHLPEAEPVPATSAGYREAAGVYT